MKKELVYLLILEKKEKKKEFLVILNLMKKLKKLYRLFVVTFLVSSTTSGGHAITAVLKPIFIEKYHWLDEDELLDLISIGQATPGSIAINVSVILGYNVAGSAGAIVAMLGTIIPPFVMMLLVTIFYEKIVSNIYVDYFMEGMQAGVTALLLYITIDSFKMNMKQCDVFGYVLMTISFIYVVFTNYSLLYLLLFCLIAVLLKTIIDMGSFLK